MIRLYNTALAPLRLLAEICAIWHKLRGRRAREWQERLARALPGGTAGGLWLHGSSAGEARVVAALARQLRAERPDLTLVASSFTPAGRGQLPAPPMVDSACFVPLDFAGLPTRVLRALRPRALVLIETELWPNLVGEARAARVPVVVLNGRLSAHRMARYRRLHGLYAPLLDALERVGAQSAADAARFVELGIAEAKIDVTGNIKYDIPAPPVDPHRLRERLGLAAQRHVFVAGSTREGEDALVLAAFCSVRTSRRSLVMILAPRHPERAPEAERQCRRAGLVVQRLSCLESAGATPWDVLLVDTIGELSALYGVADVAFVGGSLLPFGGHNVLEPAAAGVPVLFGPHTEHFAEPAAELLARNAGRQVRDPAELSRALRELLGDARSRERMAAAARQVVETNRGALRRSLALLATVLDQRADTRATEAG